MERESDSEGPSEERERDGQRVVERGREKEREREKKSERGHTLNTCACRNSVRTQRTPQSWIFEKQQTIILRRRHSSANMLKNKACTLYHRLTIFFLFFPHFL